MLLLKNLILNKLQKLIFFINFNFIFDIFYLLNFLFKNLNKNLFYLIDEISLKITIDRFFFYLYFPMESFIDSFKVHSVSLSFYYSILVYNIQFFINSIFLNLVSFFNKLRFSLYIIITGKLSINNFKNIIFNNNDKFISSFDILYIYNNNFFLNFFFINKNFINNSNILFSINNIFNCENFYNLIFKYNDNFENFNLYKENYKSFFYNNNTSLRYYLLFNKLNFQESFFENIFIYLYNIIIIKLHKVIYIFI
jgi:hypothetical protein